MEEIKARIDALVEEVTALQEEADTPTRGEPIEIELAVKTRTIEQISVAAAALLEVGRPALLAHNRVQEAAAQLDQLRERFGSAMQLSLIGPLQSNKVNHALRCFDLIETVASVELAAALSSRLPQQRELPVLIQVNTSGEATKSGVSVAQALELAQQVAELEHLTVRGFMTIGAHTDDEIEIRRSFAALRQIRDEAITYPKLGRATTLSMGMSADYRLAIAEGATRIRVGSNIFGAR